MNRFSAYSYQAFGKSGDFIRPAKIIGELPTPELRREAIKKAGEVLGLNVQFGVTIGATNQLPNSHIESDRTGLLKLRGEDLPLSLLK